MTSLYTIINDNSGVKCPFSEKAILEVIKSLQGRNKKLQEHYIEKWEILEGKKFDKKYLNLI